MVNKVGGVCAIISCNNYKVQQNSRAFHRFPREKELCAKWVHQCRRKDLDILLMTNGSTHLNKSHRICSDHFQISDYNNPNLKSQGLKPGIVPSVNLGQQSTTTSKRKSPKEGKNVFPQGHVGPGAEESSLRKDVLEESPGISDDSDYIRLSPVIMDMGHKEACIFENVDSTSIRKRKYVEDRINNSKPPPRQPQHQQMHWAKTFDEFKTIMRDHEDQTTTKYVHTYGRKSFSDEKLVVTNRLKLHWQNDVPYFHFGTRTYLCHQGKDTNAYKKHKYALERDKMAASSDAIIRRYNKVQLSKKLSCPAMILVTRVFRMTDYKLGSKLTEKRKKRISNTIKDKILACEEISGEEGYMFNLPTLTDHKYHPLGAVIEPLDERVKAYVIHLVHEGKSNPIVISKLLYEFVEKQLYETDKGRRNFYPTIESIRRVIARTKNDMRVCKVDQENTEAKVNIRNTPVCNVVFRPCTVENVTCNADVVRSDNDDDDVEQKDEKDEIDNLKVQCSISAIYGRVNLRSKDENTIIHECNATMKSVQAILCHLKCEQLSELSQTLKETFEKFSKLVSRE